MASSWSSIPAAWIFRLGLELAQVVVQAVEALFPELAIIPDPLGGLLKGVCLEGAEMLAPVLSLNDEPRPLQIRDVFGDGLLGDPEGLGQVAD